MMAVKCMKITKNQKPKTHSERTEFVVNNAPKTVGGIKMIARFFEDIKNNN